MPHSPKHRRTKSELRNDPLLKPEKIYSAFTRSTVFVNDHLPLFHPFGPFRYFWDLFTMVILLFTCIEAPVSLAFNIHLSITNNLGRFALFVDICLLCDVIINFRTAYFDDLDALKLIIDPMAISKKYLKSWFIIDIFTCIPFQLITSFNDTEISFAYEFLFFLRIFKALRVIKVIRFLKMVNVFDHTGTRGNVSREVKAALKLFKLIFFMLLFAHFSACVWWFVGQHANGDKHWIDLDTVNINNGWEGYSHSWYWAIVTLMTTGYGDITATNTTEQWVSSVCIIMGTIFFSYFIGTLTVLITEGDKDRAFEVAKLEEARSFCALKKLPKEMTRAILTHIKYHCSYNFVFDEDELMQSLPTYLQSDVQKYLSYRILSQIDMFKSLNVSILGQIALKMKCISCNEDYELFKIGDRAKEIFIQRTGVSTMKLYDIGKKQKIIELHRGDICGEMSILSPKRKVSIECNTWSEFYVIKVQDVISILQKEYPGTWTTKWLKIRNVVHNYNYVTTKNFKIRKITFNRKHQTVFSDHNIHHHLDVNAVDDDDNDNGDGEADIYAYSNVDVIDKSNTILPILYHGPSTVKTRRFHGKKSVQTEWDGSVAKLKYDNKQIIKEDNAGIKKKQKGNVCKILCCSSIGNNEENEDEKEEKDELARTNTTTTTYPTITMSTIHEIGTAIGTGANTDDEFHSTRSVRSQSDPTSVGLFASKFFFKKNSSIRNQTISTAHKKKKSLFTEDEFDENESSADNLAIADVNSFYFQQSASIISNDSDDDEADIVPGLHQYEQKEKTIKVKDRIHRTKKGRISIGRIVDNLDLAHSRNIPMIKPKIVHGSKKSLKNTKKNINNKIALKTQIDLADNGSIQMDNAHEPNLKIVISQTASKQTQQPLKQTIE